MGAFISRVLFGSPKEEEKKTNEVESVEQTQAKEEAKPKVEEKAAEEKPKVEEKKVEEKPKPAAKPAIDRTIFIQRKKTDEKIVRVPGQINGNQFVGSDLERCKVIVTDYIDSITLDRCKDCDFVLSCVRGSIFARTCTNCRFIMVCGQFRCKECHDCKFFMHVKTGPVVESSTNLSIGCAEIAYPELFQHMERAKVPVMRNIWSDVHDFTPGEGHFAYSDGEHLKLPELIDFEKSMLPFTYMKDTTKSNFTFTVPNEKREALVDLSFNEGVKIVSADETGDKISVVAEGESVDSVKASFASVEPSEIKSSE